MFLVKKLLLKTEINIRVLLFAAYGPSPQNAELSTPVEFEAENTMNIKNLLFDDGEMKQYWQNYFEAFDFVKNRELLLSQMKRITGCTPGLVFAAVEYMNSILTSPLKYMTKIHSTRLLCLAICWMTACTLDLSPSALLQLSRT